MSEDELLSPHEPGAVDPAESATNTDKFREQLQSSQRLNEYYNQVVAEIRASLERAEASLSLERAEASLERVEDEVS